MRTIIVIPARYNSTRLPGKPLIKIAGKTLLQRVCEIAQKTITSINNKTEVLVATDDKRIVDHCKELNIVCVLTSIKCKTGTDRVLEATKTLSYKPDFIVNLQGDAPFAPPEFIIKLINAALEEKQAEVITIARALNWEQLAQLRAHKKTTPFSGTTVIIDKNNNALWFSKNIIPAIRNEEQLKKESDISPVYQHVGIYGYRYNMLEKYVNLPQTQYEKLEGLEQLRLLEHGCLIKVIKINCEDENVMTGIDSEEDVIRAEKILREIKQ